MIHLVLFQPEIPPNTGNIIRLAHNLGCFLHLIHPLGFEIDDKRLRRAGLDYIEWQDLSFHSNWTAYLEAWPSARRFAFTTKASKIHTEGCFQAGDHLIFGPETRGLPPAALEAIPADNRLRIPMRPGSRSLNLSNSAAVAAYEAMRQIGFPGLQ